MRVSTKFAIPVMLFLGLCVSVAAVKTDIVVDTENQGVMSLYGNHQVNGEWVTDYNDGILNIPHEMVCLLKQVWKEEFLDKGDVHVEISEKKCYVDGGESVSAIFNMGSNLATGEITGKLWMYEENSTDYQGVSKLLSYIKVSVTKAPGESSKFGRFTIDAVDEDVDTGDVVSVFRIQALDSEFSVVGDLSGENTVFTGFASASLNEAIYNLNGTGDTSISYNDRFICFKAGNSNEDCFPRALDDPNVYVNVWNYGIYNADGSRYFETVGPLTIDGVNYALVGNFGGVLQTNDGNGPGNVQRGTGVASDAEFYTNKSISMDANGVSQPMLLNWLFKTHSVPPSVAKRKSQIDDNSGIQFTLTADKLGDPSALDPDIAKSIGPIPRSVFDAPLKAKAGTLL